MAKEKSVGEKRKLNCDISKVSKKELPYGQVEFVVSTGSVDRHGEKINQDGINIKNYKGTVLWSHDHYALPIGKTIKIWKDKTEGALKAIVQFATEELDFAKDVYKLIVGEYIKDASIGGIVEEWSEDYTTIEKLEMIEFSVCNVGANRDAGVLAKAIGKTEEEFNRDYEKSLLKHLQGKLKSKSEKEIMSWVKTLKDISVALEGGVDGISEVSAKSPEGRERIKLVLRQAKEADVASEHIIKKLKVRLINGSGE
jgi:HK97 family phage prohead protease